MVSVNPAHLRPDVIKDFVHLIGEIPPSAENKKQLKKKTNKQNVW